MEDEFGRFQILSLHPGIEQYNSSSFRRQLDPSSQGNLAYSVHFGCQRYQSSHQMGLARPPGFNMVGLSGYLTLHASYQWE
jgi:hypothetical protein